LRYPGPPVELYRAYPMAKSPFNVDTGSSLKTADTRP